MTQAFLLATKLHIPRSRPQLLARPRLLERLRLVQQYKLTLVCAPAGFGKTTLLAEWCSSPPSNLDIGWLSLDTNDNDPLRFWTYFLAALQKVAPEVAAEAQNLLIGSPDLPVEAVLTGLVNAISQQFEGNDRQLALILDDYHLIDNQAIHDSLKFLLDNLPVAFHLVLASRHDPPLPLPRLRARGQLNEIRESQLRFNLGEATDFLNRQLVLAPGEIARIEAWTEGWAAGLQLAALSLQNQTSGSPTFNGTNRYILDYLAQEVFEQQPVEVQSFLLETSILEQFSVGLAQAVTGQAESAVRLEYLERANLFIVALDEAGQWYRYHHLFRDFLRKNLERRYKQEVISELHRRAGEWFAEQGLVAEAIEHYLSRQDFEQVARLVEQVGRATWMQGAGTTLLGWLEKLPPALVQERPQLLLFYAWALISAGRSGAAWQQLNYLKTPPAKLEGEWLTLQSTLARLREDVAATIEYSNQALERLPTDNLTLRSTVALNLGHAYRLQGQVLESSASFAQAASVAQTARNNYIALIALNNQAQMEWQAGHLQTALEVCQQALRWAADHRLQRLPTLSLTHYFQAEVYYQWNDLEMAETKFNQALELGRLSNALRHQMRAYLGLAKVALARSNPRQALELLEIAAGIAAEQEMGGFLREIEVSRVGIWLGQREIEPVLRWLAECGLNPNDRPDYRREVEYLMLARVLIARGRARESLPMLDWWRGLAQSGQRQASLIEISLLQGLANRALGQTAPAFAALQTALRLAEPAGYLRLFLDEGPTLERWLAEYTSRQTALAEPLPSAQAAYIEKLRTNLTPELTGFATAEPGASQATPTAEPLSEREIEVLQHLAAGLSNQAIARRLMVADSTIKTHLKNIYRKLRVESRTQAVMRAGELGLLI